MPYGTGREKRVSRGVVQGNRNVKLMLKSEWQMRHRRREED